MAYDVTSWFIGQAQAQYPAPIVRKLLIGTSDYSDRVVRWPTITRRWDDPRPVTITQGLHNQDQQLNVFFTTPTELRKAVSIQVGFTHPTSGDELITLFAGTATASRFKDGNVELTVADKFKQLSERAVGSDDTPEVFSGGAFLPSDVAWSAITSWGGYSDVQSTSNPDIDYAAFQTWSQVFSSDSTFMDARFTGQKVVEVLRKLARYTQSAIFIEENKISFARFGFEDSNVSSWDDVLNFGLEAAVDDSTTVNRQHCLAGYNVDSSAWAIDVFATGSASVNSFGLREFFERDQNIWYVTSVSALNFAQRVLAVKSVPTKQLAQSTGLAFLPRQVGETISLVNSFLSIGEPWRIMGYTLQLQDGRSTGHLENTQIFGQFTLDISTLDGLGDLLG